MKYYSQMEHFNIWQYIQYSDACHINVTQLQQWAKSQSIYIGTKEYLIHALLNYTKNSYNIYFVKCATAFYTEQYRMEVKGKEVPLQARKGPEGSRKLRFPDFMTTAQDGGKVVSLMYWLPLSPGNAPGTHFR
jgi:hypothetical protein